MIIYEVTDQIRHCQHFSAKRQAIRKAKSWSREGIQTDVYRLDLGKVNKALILAILNDCVFCQRRDLVWPDDVIVK
jgi:hypothetical protein